MNKAFLIGNLTRDPETRTAASGITMCRFGLAVNRRRKQEGQPEADFFNVICFRQLGELAQKYLSKGRKVSVVGSIQISSFDGQDGVKRQAVDIIADDLEFLPNANSGASATQQGDSGYYGQAPATVPVLPKTYASPPGKGFVELDEDELPF